LPSPERRFSGFLLFLALVLLATLPLVLLSGVQGVIYVRDRSAAAAGRLAEAAEAIANRTDEYLEMHRQAMVALAAGIALNRAAAAPPLDAWLAHQRAAYPGFLTLIATDREGRIIAANPAAAADGRPIVSTGLAVADRAYFQQPRATGLPYVSEAFRGRGFGGDPIVAVSAPVLGAGGEFLGIVEGSLNLQAFQRFGGVYHRIEGTEIFILDAAGKVLWSSPGLGYPPLADARALARLARPGAVADVEIDGESYLLASARSRAKSWLVLVRRPRSEVLSGLIASYVLIALGVVAAVGLSALLARMIVARASQPLRESERRYREVVAHSFGMICTHDLQGRLLMINPAAADLLGYRPEELVGRNLRELLMPEVQEQFSRYLRQVETGEPVEGLLRLRTRRGEERVWMYRNHLAEEDGKLLYVVGQAMDVTEQRREEKVLKRHAAELARINAALQAEIEQRAQAEGARHRFFDMSLEMLCIAGYDGYFKELNSAWVGTLGWSLEELKARPFVELVHPDDRQTTNTESHRLRLGGNVLDFENRYLTKDGTYRWLSWRSSPAPDRGLIYAVARDVQEQKRIEQMKNDFVSVVSHELRTPLTSIRGSLGLIAGGVAGELPEKVRSLVDIAAKNSERLVRLINDILDVEKIESGKVGFRFAPLELMPLIEQAVEGNRAYAEAYGVELRIARAVPGARVWADADRILQVMTNLLSNAAKFSPRAGVVEVAVERRNGHLRAAVTDQGKGVPQEFLSRIFEKFAQADASSTRQKGGTGLGLSISKAIVERHDGHIGFEGGTGDGTTFFFELPEWLAGGSREAAPEPDERPRILVCEDDRDVARLLCLMLEREGYRADVAFDGAEAKRLMRERVYAAMTLDLILPGQDGVSLIRELRQEEATCRLPIVVVSARAEEGRTELNGGALGVVDWLVKPIDEEHLMLAVRRAVQRRLGHGARVLHVEDDPDLQRVVAAIVDQDARVEQALNLAEARERLGRERFDLVILDLALPDGSGLELLPFLGNLAPPTPVLVFSAHELEPSIAGRVAAVLVKSQTSNRELLERIRSVLAGGA